MRLQWSEIRARAAEFAERHKGAHYEKGESQTFSAAAKANKRAARRTARQSQQ